MRGFVLNFRLWQPAWPGILLVVDRRGEHRHGAVATIERRQRCHHQRFPLRTNQSGALSADRARARSVFDRRQYASRGVCFAQFKRIARPTLEIGQQNGTPLRNSKPHFSATVPAQGKFFSPTAARKLIVRPQNPTFSPNLAVPPDLDTAAKWPPPQPIRRGLAAVFAWSTEPSTRSASILSAAVDQQVSD